MKLRSLNDEGILKMEAFLDSLSTDSPDPWPKYLLTDSKYTSEIDQNIDIEETTFFNRFEAAEYLNRKLGDSGIPNIARHKGIWAWLALFYFEQLCPSDKNGVRQSGQRHRFIYNANDYRNYYRHLLAGPFLIYRAHRNNPERALVALCNPLHKPGDIPEQLAARQEIITNAGFMEAATCLYINAKSKSPKRGSGGKGPGSPRRLAEMFNQFDITWDLHSMNATDILTMLPKEFDKFKSKEEVQK